MIFMVNAPPFVDGVSPELPRIDHPVPLQAAEREDAIRVSVTRDGYLFFRDLQIQVDDLGDKVQAAVRKGAEAKVYIEVDKRARYGDLAAVLDALRSSRITNVAFITESEARH